MQFCDKTGNVWVFAIDEPCSPARALYATLNSPSLLAFLAEVAISAVTKVFLVFSIFEKISQNLHLDLDLIVFSVFSTWYFSEI